MRIYDATTDGWKAEDFHRCCDKKGPTLTIVETKKDFIFGGFTRAEWESPDDDIIHKPDPHSFLFSVNEGRKYPITSEGTRGIMCSSGCCAIFGHEEIVINDDSNDSEYNYCFAYRENFILPSSIGSQYPSINGGDKSFQPKQFEVYSVSVRITINIIFRRNEWRDIGMRD